MAQESTNNNESVGIVKIADDVIAVIAGIAVTEIKGIAGVRTGITSGITQLLGGKKDVSKGVKVTIAETGAILDITIDVVYGAIIPKVVGDLQKAVKETVEGITGIKIYAINIFVQGIVIEETPAEEIK